MVRICFSNQAFYRNRILLSPALLPNRVTLFVDRNGFLPGNPSGVCLKPENPIRFSIVQRGPRS